MTGLATVLLLVVALQIGLLFALLTWGWWNLTRGPRGAWIADAHSAWVEHTEAMELLGKDMHETLTEVERLLTRIADATDESVPERAIPVARTAGGAMTGETPQVLTVDDLRALAEQAIAAGGIQVFINIDDDLVECAGHVDNDGDLVLRPLSWRLDGAWQPPGGGSRC